MNKSKKVCFLYTDTNGLHNTNENVSKKNMFEFARLIRLKYIIGYYEKSSDYHESNKFKELKKEKLLLKPKCIRFNEKAQEFHNIEYSKAMKKGKDNEYLMNKFKNDLKDVDIIIGHNLMFHLKTIQVELFRSCTYINFNNFTLVDIMKFGHNLVFPSLDKLQKKFNIKDKNDNIKLIKKLFPKLYNFYINKPI